MGIRKKIRLLKQKSQHTLVHGWQERLALNPSSHIHPSEKCLYPTVEREVVYDFQKISGSLLLEMRDGAIMVPRRGFYSCTCN